MPTTPVIGKTLLRATRAPEGLLANVLSRDAALCVSTVPSDVPLQDLAAFFGLPWRLVLLKDNHEELLRALEAQSNLTDAMVRKRGFVQIIDSDPSRIELPSRCLPIYLLNGRAGISDPNDFASRLRTMTMLEELRRSGVRNVLVLSSGDQIIPPELVDLWSSGFRAHLTIVSSSTAAEASARRWLDSLDGVAAVQLIQIDTHAFVADMLRRFVATYPEDRRVIRIRDQHGGFHTVDITEADEPERPILHQYSIIEERDVTRVAPAELSEEEFTDFFRNPNASWRPYAAELPWVRDRNAITKLFDCLKQLDAAGAADNRIAYISCESGAGGTTFARLLAWECAREGYPVLVAKEFPFVPDALPVANFLTRVRVLADQSISDARAAAQTTTEEPPAEERRYETPWLILFDDLHWQHRAGELTRFRHELEKSGRPVCLLVVTSTGLGLSVYNDFYHQLALLNHTITRDEARALGRHLNQFLRLYNKARDDWQWDQFYEAHTVRHTEGIAAFWVTLSFWLQGQFDLSESIQAWMHRCFTETVPDPRMREALLQIAAMSSERVPLPDGLLPSAQSEWPMSQLLEHKRKDLAALGLVHISSDGQRYWALVHDILGRFLINAVFYDYAVRDALGYAAAQDAEHLRFMVLQKLSRSATLGERAFRSVGEEFATSIFKIDPGQGRGSFAPLWREVLDSLDKMAPGLRDTSRVFRHHTAISRRRVAHLNEEMYGVTPGDKVALLERAVADINYALTFIDYTPGSESNLNLYNSLANAYFNLANAEAECGASRERVGELRSLANDATRKAYAESPTNSFVIETYVKNLLQSARDAEAGPAENCIKVLGIVFAALSANEAAYRGAQLGELAEEALTLLFKDLRVTAVDGPLNTPTDVLVQVWRILRKSTQSWSQDALATIPKADAEQAIELLSTPVARGNMLTLRLRYDLTCLVRPLAFNEQLELVEQLQGTDYYMTPQLRMEYAILLFQVGRSLEGEREFRSLRRLWRETEHFVYVPGRLRWLLSADGKALKAVQAVAATEAGDRTQAKVREFGNALVPYRPEEHGLRDVRPGFRFSGHVSFGHNGPFLRPVTAGPHGR